MGLGSCWLEPQHPDATGEQLGHIVKALRWHAEQWREFFPDMGVFWVAVAGTREAFPQIAQSTEDGQSPPGCNEIEKN